MDSAKKTKMSNRITVAIDGPAGSGKSTTARAVAKQIGYTFIDSGAMYRAVTLKVLDAGISPNDADAVAQVAHGIDIRLEPNEAKTLIFIDGVDCSSSIREERIAKNIGAVAANSRVREELVKRQQEMGRKGGVVMDGRDIGTVVFPFAQLKVYMTASASVRADRRMEEYARIGDTGHTHAEVQASIEQRDHNDMNRDVGPLKQADDAVLLDTDKMTIDEQITEVIRLVKERESNQ